MRVPALTVAVAVGVSWTVEAQRGPFSVGSMTAEPGAMVSGMLEIPAAKDVGTEIPITVAHGTQQGPVLALVAGNHGYEYSPILALQRLRNRLDPLSIRGTLIMVHVANLPSFLGRTIYYSPIDGKNLNRVYPGKADGTTSERIAYAITTEVIEQSDYLVDLHCGDGNESLRHYVYMPETGRPALDDATRRMVLAFGIDHIVVDRGRPTDPRASLYCSTTGTTRGKPSFTVESGYLGTRDRGAIERIVDGALSLMRHLDMLDGASEPVETPLFLHPTEVLRSPVTGILYPEVERGHTVAQGGRIATVTDFFGRRIGEMTAPFGGVVLYIVATPPIRQGEPVAMIGAIRP